MKLSRFKVRSRILPGRSKFPGGSSIPIARTGLTFPSNTTEAPRFKFTGANLNSFVPATYIWRYYPIQHAGYNTTFFRGNDGSFSAGDKYYGFHPYPSTPPSSTAHIWEISANGTDHPYPTTTDDNGNSIVVSYDRWYSQASVCRLVSGTNYEFKFYWDLETNTNRVLTYNFTQTLANPSSPVLVFGGAPWATTTENMSGHFRGLQIYDNLVMTLSDIVTEAANQDTNGAQTSAGQGALWYINQNLTPSDITDKSVNGHNPSWHDSGNKATLWEE